MLRDYSSKFLLVLLLCLITWTIAVFIFYTIKSKTITHYNLLHDTFPNIFHTVFSLNPLILNKLLFSFSLYKAIDIYFSPTFYKILHILGEDCFLFFHSPKFCLSVKTWLGTCFQKKLPQHVLVIVPILKTSVVLVVYTIYFILYWIIISLFMFMDCILKILSTQIKNFLYNIVTVYLINVVILRCSGVIS